MDLTTTYLGLKLKHPIVASASPLSKTLDNIKRMEDAGAAAVVMYSLFEEQIMHESHRLDHFLSYGTDSYGEAMSYFPDLGNYHNGPEQYLELIRQAKESVGIPIIGSLNGVSAGGWVDYAKKIEEAGADALELNLYYIATDPHVSGGAVEQMYLEVAGEVREVLSIPLALKVGPYFSSTANMAHRFAQQKVDGMVLFNRFYQPDFDLERLEVVPNLVLSSSDELRLPLRWIAILYGRVKLDFALSSGIHYPEDVVKGVMAGAKVTMVTSALLKKGLPHLAELIKGVARWMEEHEYESIHQMQGSMSQMHVTEPGAFERANYMKMLQSWQFDPTGMLR